MAIVQQLNQVLTTDATQTITLPQPPVAGNTLIVLLTGASEIFNAETGAPPNITLTQDTTHFHPTGGNSSSQPSVENLGTVTLHIWSCSGTQALTLANIGPAYAFAPSIQLYELSGVYWSQAAYMSPGATGFNSEIAITVPQVNSDIAYSSWIALICAVSLTDFPSLITGRGLIWTKDGTDALTPPGGLSGQLYTNVLHSSAVTTHPDIGIDAGFSSGRWALNGIILPWASPASVTTINGIQLTDTPNFSIDSSGNMHIRVPYLRGHFDAVANVFTAASNPAASADYQLASTDTFAQAWSGLLSAINTAETISLSMANTGLETTGIAHFHNAYGGFDNDILYSLTDTGRITSGTILYH